MRRIQPALVLLIVLAILPLTSSYALEGRWALTNHKDLDLDPSVEVEFEFKKDILNKSIIAHELVVKSCYQLSYDYEIHENDIVFNYKRIIDIPRKCVEGEITTIRAKLDTVFYFTINGTTLKLFNPTGFAPFVFKRIEEVPPKAINGLWQTLRVLNFPAFVDITVNGTHAVLCGGQGIAIYKINGINEIVFTILRSRGCS